MGILNKFKEMFTEEIEEEPVKRETRHVEVKRSVEPEKEIVNEIEEDKKEVVEETSQPKEDKFVFFSDDDFKDLEKCIEYEESDWNENDWNDLGEWDEDKYGLHVYLKSL